MYSYLIMFRAANREFRSEIGDAQRIAQLTFDGEHSEIRVYRLLPDDEPRPLWIHTEHKSRSMWLTDRYGNHIESAQYNPA